MTKDNARFIQDTLREGIILGVEHAQRLVNEFPIEQALVEIERYKTQMKKELENGSHDDYLEGA